MALSARDIFETLSEWPHRGVGTEEEMEAREMLMAKLSGEIDVDVNEEGFFTPRSYLPFFWLIALGQCFFVLLAGFAPLVMMVGGLMLLLSHLWFFDWRVARLVWLTARSTTANLVARKGAGQRLFILMAHIDSAPASFAYRPQQVKHFKLNIWLATGIVSFGVCVPLADLSGIDVPMAVQGFCALALLAQVVMASIDCWRFGYTPGANDNLTGVAAATEAASRLWANMPDDAEVRLVITTAEEAGMLGAQHYWEQHEEELHTRDTHVLNFDTVGSGRLGYVVESGGFTPVYYDTPLAHAAHALVKLNKKFEHIGPARHKVGDFDSVWFVRDGISALTLAAYDEHGHMPHIHTMEDSVEKVDLDRVEEAAGFGEAIIRLVPKRAQKQRKTRGSRP
ncbi:M28 family metallopeptidase [Kordiimonas sp.]|uniref:M28 family metallopeptidase n=1 Tax=Kordiimonas sp. TaxID=1970157 RepID=UPI003A914D92